MIPNASNRPIPAPQLDDFDLPRSSLLGDLAGGTALLLAWALLWSWFALAVVPPERVPQAPLRPAAVDTRA